MPQRRRFLAIAASWSALGPAAMAMPTPQPVVWKGVTLGALASMSIVHPDRAHAQALLARSLAEIERLEGIFSLYRSDSVLSRLNAAGHLAGPPTELVELLSFSLSLARATDGAFDPSVQPLFNAYLEHFSQPGAAPAGPPPARIKRALASVGFADVELDSGHVRLHRPGAALTLNGVAQGFITDRVATLLRAGGLDNVLLDLGEARAMGRHADGQPWRAAVRDPGHTERTLFDQALGNDRGQWPALATSGGYGTVFGTDPRVHHLLDPRSGHSANYHASVSVAAPNATLADGLSTALCIVPPARADALVAAHPGVRAWFVDGRSHVTTRDTRHGPAHQRHGLFG